MSVTFAFEDTVMINLLKRNEIIWIKFVLIRRNKAAGFEKALGYNA